MADSVWRKEMLDCIARLRPDSPRRFGTMTPAQMVAHLTDQMGHTLGDVPTTPVPGIRRTALVRWLAIYVVPWPKGTVKGPAEAFVTKPVNWDDDIARLCALVERFAGADLNAPFPQHAFFSGR